MRLQLWFLVVCVCGFFMAPCQEKPKKAYQYYEEAEAAYNDDEYARALVILDECLKQYPGHFEAYSLRGSVKEILKDDDGALTDYSIYLEEFPDHLPCWSRPDPS